MNIVFRRDLEEPEYRAPYHAAERGFVDDVIDPAQTRSAVARGLAMLCGKRTAPPRREHGDVPL